MIFEHPETGLQINCFVEHEQRSYVIVNGKRKLMKTPTKLLSESGQLCFPVKNKDGIYDLLQIDVQTSVCTLRLTRID